jgi:hypothetical protein
MSSSGGGNPREGFSPAEIDSSDDADAFYIRQKAPAHRPWPTGSVNYYKNNG